MIIAKMQNNNNAKQVIMLSTLTINCNKNKTLIWELHAWQISAHDTKYNHAEMNNLG